MAASDGAVAALHPALKFYSSKLRQIDSSSSLLVAVVQQQRCWMSCERLVHQCPLAPRAWRRLALVLRASRQESMLAALCLRCALVSTSQNREKQGETYTSKVTSCLLPSTLHTQLFYLYTLTNSQFEKLCMFFFVSQFEVLGKIAYHIL